MNIENDYLPLSKQDFDRLKTGDVVYFMNSEDILVELKIEKLEFPFVYNANEESWTYSSLMKKTY
jgi:hypothetical protein